MVMWKIGMTKKIMKNIITDLSNVTYASDYKVYFIFNQTYIHNMAFENLKKSFVVSFMLSKQ